MPVHLTPMGKRAEKRLEALERRKKNLRPESFSSVYEYARVRDDIDSKIDAIEYRFASEDPAYYRKPGGRR